jgi:hypothetical protein
MMDQISGRKSGASIVAFHAFRRVNLVSCCYEEEPNHVISKVAGWLPGDVSEGTQKVAAGI